MNIKWHPYLFRPTHFLWCLYFQSFSCIWQRSKNHIVCFFLNRFWNLNITSPGKKLQRPKETDRILDEKRFFFWADCNKLLVHFNHTLNNLYFLFIAAKDFATFCRFVGPKLLSHSPPFELNALAFACGYFGLLHGINSLLRISI